MALILEVGLGGVGVILVGFCWVFLRASASMQAAERSARASWSRSVDGEVHVSSRSPAAAA